MPSQLCPKCDVDRPRFVGAKCRQLGPVLWFFICPSCGHTWSEAEEGTERPEPVRDKDTRTAG